MLAEVYTEEARRAKYEENPAAYRTADLIAYTVSVNLTGVSGEEAMRAEYLRAEARAARIAASTSEAEFIAAVRADLQGEQPSLTARSLDARVDGTYFYYVSPAESGLAAEWVHKSGRTAGETAVLGETGYYTVVYCLSAPRLAEDYPAKADYLFLPYADYRTENEAVTAAEALRGQLENGTGGASSFAALSRGGADKPVCDYLLSPERQVGDTAVILGYRGVYVLCYQGKADLPLWELQVAATLQAEEYAAMERASGLSAEGDLVLPSLVPTL